jgi:error-prone DNA polymerase
MGWDNPAVPWRELERRLSWGTGEPAQDAGPDRPRRVIHLPAPRAGDPGVPPWAELHCHSSYSFLDGASSPAELVAEAARLGLEALAITDHNGMYGVPQFAQAAAKLTEQTGVKLGTVFGAELSVNAGIERAGAPDPAGRHLLVLARDPAGYRRLCWAISVAQLAGGEKGRPIYDLDELARAQDGHWVILTGCRKGAVRAALTAQGPEAARKELQALREAFGRDNVVVELTSHDLPEDDERNDALYELARPQAPRRSPPATCTTPPPGTPGSPRRWQPSGPGAAWTRWTAGWPPPAAPTSDPARRWRTGCAATPAPSGTRSRWLATARSSSA